ncbi:MAG: hypothetical protein KKE20_04190 [Nanoarchaeota archaeon]|nr:hypothetical protein [Nanoarchaeota archaeon]
MKNTKIIITILFAALLLASCTPWGSPNKYVSIFTGTKALTLGFLKGLPPDEIYAPEANEVMPFQVGVEIQNQGSKDIEGGYLVLAVEQNFMKIMGWGSQYDITPIGASGERIAFSLDGKSDINPYGQKELYTVDITPLSIGDQRVQHTANLVVTACYDYITEMSRDVCIDTDIYNVNPTEKTCQANDISVSGGQGAPVEVTLVEVKMLPGQGYVIPQFIIHVKNSGGGQVLESSKISDACSSLPLTYDDINVIDVDEVRFSRFSTRGGQIECTPDKIKLKNEEGKTRCQLRPGALSSSDIITYTTPLYVKLSYGYSHTISKQVLMKNILAD